MDPRGVTSPWGHVAKPSSRCTATPRAASTLLAPLIALAPHATLGLIRTSAPYTLGLTEIASAYPLAGEVKEHEVRSHRHLLADHVPDAHGIQVLTERHLARAHDLSAWDITDLGAGRHLVAAADLAPGTTRPCLLPRCWRRHGATSDRCCSARP